VSDPLAYAPTGVTLVRELPQAPFDLVVLAIKPQQFAEVAPRLGRAAGDALVLSILAGVEIAQLSAAFPGARVARIMANLAAAFGQSPVALFAGPGLTDADRGMLDRLGAALGPVAWLDDEARMHAVTALAGSGPGFVYRLLEAFAKGGAELGLEETEAMTLAMFRGALALAARSGEDFATLAARVASPGGTTRAGLDALETEVDRLIAATLRAARDRSEQLASGD
jgi:pyrroline-5-carboxylate reductase